MLDYVSELWQTFLNRPDHLAVLSIIPVTAFVTWAHVWMALKMVFYPITFWGFHLGTDTRRLARHCSTQSGAYFWHYYR